MQPGSSPTLAFLGAIVFQTPLLIVATVGIFLSFGEIRRSYRKVASWALAGSGALFIHVLVNPATQAYLVASVHSPFELGQRARLMIVSAALAYVLLVLSFLFLTIAVYVQRYQDYVPNARL